jgi:hypothetical protein
MKTIQNPKWSMEFGKTETTIQVQLPGKLITTTVTKDKTVVRRKGKRRGKKTQKRK